MRGGVERRRPQLHVQIHGDELDEAARIRLRLFRASGGALYHWRALRSGRRWRPFRAEVERWLEGWPVRPTELVLIGPSGGHTLPTPWLKRFAQVHAYDLDPLAPPIFRARHRGVNVHFRREDVFWRSKRLDVRAAEAILNRHSGAAILFSNVIGQVLLEGRASETEWTSYLLELRRVLKGRAWASYHDRYTFENGEVIDHLTGGGWTAGLRSVEFDWNLTSISRHRIEAVRSEPTWT